MNIPNPLQAPAVSYTDISNVCVNNKTLKGLSNLPGCEIFLPLNEVDSLIQYERVRLTLTELGTVPESEMHDLVDYIINRTKKIFLILVFTRTTHNIADIKASNFGDEHLPVYITGQQTDSWATEYLADTQGQVHRQGLGHSQGSNIFLADFSWPEAEKDILYEKQWIFLAPVFSQSCFEYTFEQYRPLPFLPAALPGGGSGHFGKVQRFKLHFAHCGDISSEFTNGGSDEGFDVAVKLLNQQDEDTDVNKFYHKETSTLEVMRNLKKDHLIRAIASYKKGENKYFLFPWAKAGNLQDMLAKDERKLDKDLINWIVCQIVGLSEGIAALHARNIRHGDIKPPNILCDGPDLEASNKSILLIADVGLAKKHEAYTRYRANPTTTRHGSIKYELPEVSSKNTLGPLSRRYDIWSLGCVFLELFIWAVYGTNDIKTFHRELNNNGTPCFWKDRKFHSGEKVHSAVRKRFKDLKKDFKDLPALAQLIGLIEEKLLKVSVNERAYSKAVHEELKTIKEDIGKIPEDRFNTELAKIKLRRGRMATLPGIVNQSVNDLSTQHESQTGYQPPSQTEITGIVDSSISAASAEGSEPTKYNLDDRDALADKNDKEANFEMRNWNRSSEHINATELEIQNIEGAESSDDGRNTIENSQFSISDYDWSRGTRPSTVPTSHPGMKEQSLNQVATILEAGELEITRQGEPGTGDIYSPDPLAQDRTEEEQLDPDKDDVETTYSVETISDNPKLRYLQDFAEQLTEDMKQFSDEPSLGNIGAEYIDTMLREFAWKLHGESINPFQWETSVILHKKRKNIIELLVSHPPDYSSFETEEDEDVISENEDHDEVINRIPHIKSITELTEWRNDVAASPSEDKEMSPSTEDDHIQDDRIQDDIEHEHEYALEEPSRRPPHSLEIPSQLPHYKEFIKKSDAYHWLLARFRQHEILTIEKSDAMLEIKTKIRNQLLAQESLRKMSSRKSSSVVKMTFTFDWKPLHSMLGIEPSVPYGETLSRAVCLTGSWNEAQAATIRDYMDQTWPRSGHTLITLIQTLLSIPEGQECSYPAHEFSSSKNSAGAEHLPSKVPRLTACVQSGQSTSLCCISVTGHLDIVSEIGEQIGWLASALQSSSDHHGPVACTPRVKDIQVATQGGDSMPHAPMVVGLCKLYFNLEAAAPPESSSGFCWSQLFCDPVLVRGYPILRRTQPNTGLEMSLDRMAAIVGSQQVVKWGDRIIIKGFNMLMIATMVAVDLIVWHLLVSEQPEERISYVDCRLDTLASNVSKETSLRMLEEKRHVIGWCSKAIEMCGDATASLNIETSSLPEPPATIVIERLYIGIGANLSVGFSMLPNTKQKPFHLKREKDYLDLLTWVRVQLVVFYVVTDGRPWLTDGASALLHLTRVSLYIDENNPESVYRWLFDTTKFKDKWPGFSGRQAALKTLSSEDNLDLNLYAVGKKRGVDGGLEIAYTTLRMRVEKILHALEVLIDTQPKSGSQDGIRIPQTVDFRQDIIGFDIRDIIEPGSTIYARIKYMESRGPGWIDFIPSIGTATIFGRGFGDLIKPEEQQPLCTEWKTVPINKDYMVASVSILQLLHQRRLLRMEPGLKLGETSNVIWASFNHPFEVCECLKRSSSNTRGGDYHLDSTQFLVANGLRNLLKLRLKCQSLKSIDIMELDEKGAVVFGHIPSLSLMGEGKSTYRRQDEGLGGASSVDPSRQGTPQPSSASAAISESIGRAESTDVTSPSVDASQSVGTRENGIPGKTVITGRSKKSKRWNIFKRFRS